MQEMVIRIAFWFAFCSYLATTLYFIIIIYRGENIIETYKLMTFITGFVLLTIHAGAKLYESYTTDKYISDIDNIYDYPANIGYGITALYHCMIIAKGSPVSPFYLVIAAIGYMFLTFGQNIGVYIVVLYTLFSLVKGMAVQKEKVMDRILMLTKFGFLIYFGTYAWKEIEPLVRLKYLPDLLM